MLMVHPMMQAGAAGPTPKGGWFYSAYGRECVRKLEKAGSAARAGEAASSVRRHSQGLRGILSGATPGRCNTPAWSRNWICL